MSPASLPPLAQTHLQLLARARELGWGEGEVARLQGAHQCAMALFAGRFRASGVPFQHHLVRTAAIALELGAPPRVVAAALLHSAYTHGDFGGLRRAPTRTRREQVRRAVGADCERLVHAYALREECEEVRLMLLCDRLEDALDDGLWHARGLRSEAARRFLEEGEAAARRAGRADLAAAFADLRPGGRPLPPRAAPDPDFLRGLGARDFAGAGTSFQLVPRSARPRLGQRVVRGWRALVGRLG